MRAAGRKASGFLFEAADPWERRNSTAARFARLSEFNMPHPESRERQHSIIDRDGICARFCALAGRSGRI